MASEIDKAWAAGFFDGEGCTSILKAQRDRYAYIRMSISQKDPECLLRFLQIVGYGKIYKSHTRNIYSWDCYKQSDVPLVMEQLYPYLSNVKREQYNVAMDRKINN